MVNMWSLLLFGRFNQQALQVIPSEDIFTFELFLCII